MLLSGRARPDEPEFVRCSSGEPSVSLPPSIVNSRETFSRVKARLLQTKEVQPPRITESAPGACYNGSRVYVRLQ